ATNPHENAFIVETLEKHPTTVAVGASGKRSHAAYQAGILEPALDAAQSAQAANSLEKRLCHQMVGAHFTVMRLLGKGQEVPGNLGLRGVVKRPSAAGRRMGVYQTACLTLQKLKARGTQRIEVRYQQVNVGEGGQAVVASTVRAGSRRQRGGQKKWPMKSM